MTQQSVTESRKKKKQAQKDLDRSGRPPIYDEREERIIVREASKKPFDSLRDLEYSAEVNPKEASKDTLSRIFQRHDMVSLILSTRLTSMSPDHISEKLIYFQQSVERNI